MNYHSHDLVQSKLNDLSREAARMNQVAEARRASKQGWARSTSQPSTWTVVRRAPAMLLSALISFGA